MQNYILNAPIFPVFGGQHKGMEVSSPLAAGFDQQLNSLSSCATNCIAKSGKVEINGPAMAGGVIDKKLIHHPLSAIYSHVFLRLPDDIPNANAHVTPYG
jgi:hypothetical protein